MEGFEDDADIDDSELEPIGSDWDLPELPTLVTDENGRDLFFDDAA